NPATLELTREEWQADHDKILDMGGLFILGTERHEARRIDNQLRGRSGRQGDPGESRFYVALDDDLMRRFGGDTIKRFMDWALEDDTPIESKAISKAIENAQVKTEAHHFDIRKHLVDYDDVVNTHRDVIYGEREKVIAGADVKANIQAMVGDAIRETLQANLVGTVSENWETDNLVRELGGMMPLSPELSDPDALIDYSYDEIEDMALDHAEMLYGTLEDEMGEANMRSLERQVMLRVVDSCWVQHLTAIDHLRQGIGLEAFGQRDPLVMYKKKGHEEFQVLQSRIQKDLVYTIYHLGSLVRHQGDESEGGDQPRRTAPRVLANKNKSVMENVMGVKREAVTSGAQKIGRNSVCPCGSGKKYKRCHGS
ncbi:MAG: hypothetical protein BZY79_04755, partial [SAR202 cluster bacterium Casp-Chloro-G4]